MRQSRHNEQRRQCTPADSLVAVGCIYGMASDASRVRALRAVVFHAKVSPRNDSK
jgi:hypothetical protein